MVRSMARPSLLISVFDGRRMRTWKIVGVAATGVCLIAGSACAHRRSVFECRDVGISALALTWTIAAAPEAQQYSLEMSGKAPTGTLRRVARAARLRANGNVLLAPDASSKEATAVTIRAEEPRWTNEREALVRTSFAVDGGPSSRCHIMLRCGDKASDWRMTSVPDGDGDCWPRPGAFRPR